MLIADRKEWGELVGLLRRQAGGLRALARASGVPAARLTEWEAERRGRISAENAERVGRVVLWAREGRFGSAEDYLPLFQRSLTIELTLRRAEQIRLLQADPMTKRVLRDTRRGFSEAVRGFVQKVGSGRRLRAWRALGPARARPARRDLDRWIRGPQRISAKSADRLAWAIAWQGRTVDLRHELGRLLEALPELDPPPLLGIGGLWKDFADANDWGPLLAAELQGRQARQQKLTNAARTAMQIRVDRWLPWTPPADRDLQGR